MGWVESGRTTEEVFGFNGTEVRGPRVGEVGVGGWGSKTRGAGGLRRIGGDRRGPRKADLEVCRWCGRIQVEEKSGVSVETSEFKKGSQPYTGI